MLPGTERVGESSPGTSSDWPDMRRVYPAGIGQHGGQKQAARGAAMALFKKRQVGKPGEWYYCLVHKKVEEGPECPAKDRFGPYATPEEAAHAMETAQERNL